MNTINDNVFRVDIEKVIRSQKNKSIRKLPKFAINYLKRMLREKELNEVVDYAGDTTGVEFVKKCMEFLNISYKTHHKENLPDTGRFIFVCNHPLGAIDFFAAILSISDNFENINVIANEILMSVKPLNDIFLPVNVFGKNKEKDKENILKRMSSEEIQMMTFPAGLVARKIKGKLDDGRWHRSFVRNAIQYKRDIIPIFIDAENSKKFYRFSKIRKRLRIKYDLDVFLLPQEIFKKRNSVIDVYFGKPIPYTDFLNSKNHLETAQEVKKLVYRLKNQN